MTSTKNTEASLFRLVYGFEPTLPLLGSAPNDALSPQNTLTSNNHTFLDSLRGNLRYLHDRVKDSITEYKQQMRDTYDKAHKVAPLLYTIGSKVWLYTSQIKAGCKSVTSAKPYKGPFYITEVKQPTTGEAGITFMLTNCVTGKPH